MFSHVEVNVPRAATQLRVKFGWPSGARYREQSADYAERLSRDDRRRFQPEKMGGPAIRPTSNRTGSAADAVAPGRSRVVWSEWIDLPLGVVGRLGWPLVRLPLRFFVQLSLNVGHYDLCARMRIAHLLGLELLH